MNTENLKNELTDEASRDEARKKNDKHISSEMVYRLKNINNVETETAVNSNDLKLLTRFSSDSNLYFSFSDDDTDTNSDSNTYCRNKSKKNLFK